MSTLFRITLIILIMVFGLINIKVIPAQAKECVTIEQVNQTAVDNGFSQYVYLDEELTAVFNKIVSEDLEVPVESIATRTINTYHLGNDVPIIIVADFDPNGCNIDVVQAQKAVFNVYLGRILARINDA
jgi:hypothetical protein